MNILFVYSQYDIASLRKPLESPELIQFGISYISSYLKRKGHRTSLLVLSRCSGRQNKEIIDSRISSFRPDIIAFTAVTTEFDFIRQVAQYVRKEYSRIYLLIGGAHVSLNPENVLEDFDALCIGEGEIPVLELASQLESGKAPSGIMNLWLKHGREIERNPPRPFLENIDSLPFPDRHMWDEWIQERPGSRPAVLLGRGCQFECSYCCNHALKRLASGAYTRYRSAPNIISEIQGIIREYPDKSEIYLEVESIGADKTWVVALCDNLARFNDTLPRPLTYGANLRIMPNLDLENIFKAFKKANFRFINIGLESGSERLRREVLNRHYSNNDIVNAVRLARENGLQVSFLNMIGLPTETLEDFKETIVINRRCLPDWVGCSIFYPYPGTKIYSLCQKMDLVKISISANMERSRAVLDLPGFSRNQIENAYIWFEYNIYKGHKSLFKLLLKTLSLKIKTRPWLFNLVKKIK